MLSISITWLQVYASSAVHSDCDVGLERARIIGFYKTLYKTRVSLSFISVSVKFPQIQSLWYKDENTSLLAAIASTTSLVNCLPTPDVPINTVGLISWRNKIELKTISNVFHQIAAKKEREREAIRIHTLIASTSSFTGLCSWAQGFLKCWSDSLRELTINPCRTKSIKTWTRKEITSNSNV